MELMNVMASFVIFIRQEITLSVVTDMQKQRFLYGNNGRSV